MATIKIEKPNVSCITYRQEKTDDDYGSCLWAKFCFDMDNYTLSIMSDCGNYMYGWTPTPETESFVHLAARFSADYLLCKLSDKTAIDGGETWKNVKEYLLELLDGKEPDFDFSDVENACYYANESEAYDNIWSSIEYTNANNDSYDSFRLYDCIATDYPASAKKIVQVYTDYIIPKLKEMEREADV